MVNHAPLDGEIVLSSAIRNRWSIPPGFGLFKNYKMLSERMNVLTICLYMTCTCEGKATRLAELALIFIPIYNVAVSDTSHSKL